MSSPIVETVKRVNNSEHRLRFTLHYDNIPVEFDVPPGGEVDVPKVWCEPRPSAGRQAMPSVLEMVAPHLVAPEKARRVASRATTTGAASGKNDSKGKGEPTKGDAGDDGIPS